MKLKEIFWILFIGFLVLSAFIFLFLFTDYPQFDLTDFFQKIKIQLAVRTLS